MATGTITVAVETNDTVTLEVLRQRVHEHLAELTVVLSSSAYPAAQSPSSTVGR